MTDQEYLDKLAPLLRDAMDAEELFTLDELEEYTRAYHREKKKDIQP